MKTNDDVVAAVLLNEDLLLLLSPDSLLVGFVVGSDVVHLALGDDTQVDVAARTQVVEDAGSDGVSHQLLSLSLLQGNNNTHWRNRVAG